MTPAFPVTRTTHPLPENERAAILAEPGFGRYFSDHMATAQWTEDAGWHDRRIGPRQPFSLDPGVAVLHYAQEIFEGLKAYRHADGSVWLFRPEANARRFARSARRIALPELSEEDFLESIEELVRTDEPWVPSAGGEASLYIRPFMFASENFLLVRSSDRATYCVITSPAGPYFPSGVTGVTLWVTRTYTRAAPGGTGAAKCGANYAASLAPQREAQQHGCEQVMYLDGSGKGTIEESGTMNLCLVTSGGELVTPGLGTILEGVTRDTVLKLAAEHGLQPVERAVTLDELRAGAADGSVTEVFAVGTAAVITPVIGFKSEDFAFTVGTGTPGKRTLALREHVLDIQYGRAKDQHGWLRRVL